MIKTDWYRLYGEKWDIPKSRSHPAKFSRALIRHIYRHCIELGWLERGDWVLDPFAGVGCGALDALYWWLNWAGVELEEKYVDRGNGNIDHWKEKYNLAGFAMVAQGDSRFLFDALHDLEVAYRGLYGASIGSPPFIQTSGGTNVTAKTGPLSDPRLIERHAAGNHAAAAYGRTPGQLEQMPEGDFLAAISSPPYAETRIGDEPDFIQVGHRVAYGGADGQLGRMLDAGFEAAVSSPPYADAPVADYDGSQGKLYRETGLSPRARQADGKLPDENYNLDNKANIATQDDGFFWSAARTIMDNVYQAIRPGGHAIWVVKAYIKNKQYIDYPDQWRQLCEAAGFVTLHYHQAWQVENRGTQIDLFGKEHTKTVEHKSYFRRMMEAKGLPRVDYEVVLCTEKPK